MSASLDLNTNWIRIHPIPTSFSKIKLSSIDLFCFCEYPIVVNVSFLLPFSEESFNIPCETRVKFIHVYLLSRYLFLEKLFYFHVSALSFPATFPLIIWHCSAWTKLMTANKIKKIFQCLYLVEISEDFSLCPYSFNFKRLLD